MKDFSYIDDVASLALDKEKCTGCGLCFEVCPRRVFEMRDKKAHIADFNACMECGACVNNCMFEAISVNPGVG